jgi:hypothetical protein
MYVWEGSNWMFLILTLALSMCSYVQVVPRLYEKGIQIQKISAILPLSYVFPR